MREILANTQLSPGNSTIESRAVERKLLALDALSKLTRQFSHQPEFQVLVRVLLLTLSGQFIVPSTFAILAKPNSRGKFYYFGTGNLHDNVELSTLEFSSDESYLSEKYGSAFRTDTPGVQEHLKSILPNLENARVKVVCPLSHGNRFFGIVGLGEKVTTRELSDEDLLLLSTMVQTITPFLANSYLYWEITDLNAWYEELINSVKQGLLVFDNAHRLKKINQAAIQALQWFDRSVCSSDLLHNKHILEIFPDHVYSTWAERLIAASQRQSSGLIQNLVARHEDRETYYNVRVSRTTAVDDSDSDLVIVLDDVTQQRQSEQHLFELQKFADKGIMASSIAHELNNFLALVAGGLEMTRLAFSRNDEQRMNANLEKLRINVASMERFTAGLMDYSRLDSSRRPTELNSLITDVISFVAVQSRFRRITVLTELATDLPDLDLDSDQISQLLLNFLNNAADAVNEAQRDDGRISVTTSCDSEGVVLEVMDNGCGIPSEAKELLFTSSFTTKPTGHGYGMVTCSKILQQHNATVEIETVVGSGTTFVVHFPMGRSEIQGIQ